MSSYNLLNKIDKIVWGENAPKQDIFLRWCQGFYFNDDEPSALIQQNGGPCAIIAAVQAAILRDILFKRRVKVSEIDSSQRMDLLVSALLEILTLVYSKGSEQSYYYVYWNEDSDTDLINNSCGTNFEFVANSEDFNWPISHSHFIQGLRYAEAENVDILHGLILSLSTQHLTAPYALLCLLYSALATHGLSALECDLEDCCENASIGNGKRSSSISDAVDSLIDPIYGHASHSLLNLLITGVATPYLFDGERDLAGFCLRGILEQPSTGFLTIVESLSYCEVGWYLKNPAYPVWVLSSETHLTVLASTEQNLVYCCEAPSSIDKSSEGSNSVTLRQAELEFIKLSDGDEAGFITADKLPDLLTRLNLPTDLDSIKALNKAINPEELDVILKEPFLRHFFPEELSKRDSPIRHFPLLHYNGLVQSNPGGHVRYMYGQANLLDPTEELTSIDPPDQSQIHRCLVTKWPTIRVRWEGNGIPSLN